MMANAQGKPLELYYWSTPNGRKVTIMLEELGVPYNVNFVEIGKREQFTPEYTVISPQNQIPGLIDPEGPGGNSVTLFESGAILMYLGRKFGRFYPLDDEMKRIETEKWLMWQMGDFGPVLGQAHHYNLQAPVEVPYAIERFGKAVHRSYRSLDARLADVEFVAGDYSIADMAIFPWASRFERHRVDFAEYPNVKRWFEAVGARPGVQRGMAVIKPGHVDGAAVVNPARAKAAGASPG
jgi:GSH-dependent disulfide-bond oxidoreductase